MQEDEVELLGSLYSRITVQFFVHLCQVAFLKMQEDETGLLRFNFLFITHPLMVSPSTLRENEIKLLKYVFKGHDLIFPHYSSFQILAELLTKMLFVKCADNTSLSKFGEREANE